MKTLEQYQKENESSIFQKILQYSHSKLDNMINKAKTNGMQDDEIYKMALDYDPMYTGEAYGYERKPSRLSNKTLLMMARRDMVIAAIIKVRQNQVAAHSRYQTNKYELGYILEKKDGTELNEVEKQEIDILKEFIDNCGWTDQRPEEELMNFDEFLRRVVEDRLIYDFVAVEKIRRNDGRLAYFAPVDGATIRFAQRKVGGEDLRDENDYGKDVTRLLSSYDKKRDEREAGEEYRYVQVIDEVIHRAFTSKDMSVRMANVSNNVYARGYSTSELELLISLVTSHLNAETYNKKLFEQGSVQKGMLYFKANISQRKLNMFKRAWYAQTSGVQNSWRTPIVAGMDEVRWVPLSDSSKDLEFHMWMEYLIKLITAIYLIDPSEINFDIVQGRSEGSPMFNSKNEYRQSQSKDRGLRPLLTFLQDLMNDILREVTDKYHFKFVGLDASNAQDDNQRYEVENRVYKSINEVRKENNLESIEMKFKVNDKTLNPFDIPANPTIINLLQSLIQQSAQPQPDMGGSPMDGGGILGGDMQGDMGEEGQSQDDQSNVTEDNPTGLLEGQDDAQLQGYATLQGQDQGLQGQDNMQMGKSIKIEYIWLDNEGKPLSDLEKGKALPVGTQRMWGGQQYVKHSDGWIAVHGKHHGKKLGKFKEAPTHVEYADKYKDVSAPKEGHVKVPTEPKEHEESAAVVQPKEEPKKIKVKRQKPVASQNKNVEQKQDVKEEKKAKKPASEMSADELIAKYTPSLVKSEYHRPMSTKEIHAEIGKFSPDDLIYHIINGDNDVVNYIDDSVEAKNKIGFKERAFAYLLNKKIPAKEKNETASYLLDKAGVTFVGGVSLNYFLGALAKKGMIDKNILKKAEEDTLGSDIYSGKISDPEILRKVNVKEHFYQLVRNPYTPADVLLKCAKEDHKYNKEYGKQVPFGAKVTHAQMGKVLSVTLSEAFSHGNMPVEEIEKYVGLDQDFVIQGLWSRKDLPEKYRELIYNKGVKLGINKEGRYYNIPRFKIPQEDFEKQFYANMKISNEEAKKTPEYATSIEYELDNMVNHPNMTPKILLDLLQIPLRKDKEENKPISALVDIRKAAYDKLDSMNLISKEDKIKKVKENLKLEGDEEGLLKLAKAAYVQDASESTIPNKILPLESSEIEELKNQLAKTTVHDDFDYEVLSAYKLQNEVHKDYQKTAKKINTVKTNLYHGTSHTNAAGIITQGINVSSKARTGQMFGEGFYLASESSKAIQYASDNYSNKGGEGVLFELSASLGKVKEMKFGRPSGDDLTYHQNLSPDEEKFFKKMEKEGKPNNTRWHYDHDSVIAKAGMSLDYDEYVVKNPNQIQLQKIIFIKKTPKKKG